MQSKGLRLAGPRCSEVSHSWRYGALATMVHWWRPGEASHSWRIVALVARLPVNCGLYHGLSTWSPPVVVWICMPCCQHDAWCCMYERWH